MIRLLLDPNPAEGGINAATEAAKAPALIPVAPERFQALLQAETDLAQSRAVQAQREAEARAAEQKALIEKGQVEQAWNAYKAQVEPALKGATERAARYQKQLHDTARSEAVARAMAGRTFVSDDARNQAISLLASQVEVHEAEDGTLTVRQPGTGVPAADALRGLLDSPAFSHFQAATARGGSGATTQQPSPDAPTTLFAEGTFAAPPGLLGGGLGLRRPAGRG